MDNYKRSDNENSPLWSVIKEYHKLHKELVSAVIPATQAELNTWKGVLDIPIEITAEEMDVLYNKVLESIKSLNYITMTINKINSREKAQ